MTLVGARPSRPCSNVAVARATCRASRSSASGEGNTWKSRSVEHHGGLSDLIGSAVTSVSPGVFGWERMGGQRCPMATKKAGVKRRPRAFLSRRLTLRRTSRTLPDCPSSRLPFVGTNVRIVLSYFSRAATTCERHRLRGMSRIILGGLGNASRIFQRACASPSMPWMDTHSHPKDLRGVASIEKASCPASRYAENTPRHTTPRGWGYCAAPAKRGAGGWQDATAGAGLSGTHAAGESLPAWGLTHDTHQVAGGD